MLQGLEPRAGAHGLVHRDYSLMGAVHVQWLTDHVEISSPGGFPEGVRLDNLLVTPPRPRNPLLADAFKRAGIVERTGRGIDTIFFEQLRNGRPRPSYERSTESSVMLVLPGGEPGLDFVRLVAEEGRAGRSLGVTELLILKANGHDLCRQARGNYAARGRRALYSRHALLTTRKSGRTPGCTSFWPLASPTRRRTAPPPSGISRAMSLPPG